MSDNETRTCPCGAAFYRAEFDEWRGDQSWNPNYCGQCGAELGAGGKTGPAAFDLAGAYEALLSAHAGTPRECGIDTDTWEDAAMLEAGR